MDEPRWLLAPGVGEDDMDAGKAVKGIFREVRGKYESFMNYGLLVEVQV